ncbi:MAG TPA: glycogen synthase GlgA [Gemmatales bacterium]|nr:glycogen synthase GlgA [Gemmatales bacterium]HMP59693.1 glycogen synthase GlgA [Gemmatales bacterium]
MPHAATPSGAPRMKILFASAEVVPFAKTGGLGEVVGSLPQALARRGHDVAVIMPLFQSCRRAGPLLEPLDLTVEAQLGYGKEYGRLWRSHLLGEPQVPVYFVEHNGLFDRDYKELGNTIYSYRGPDGEQHDYSDQLSRFAFFSKAVLNAIPVLGFWPEVLHANDWHVGLIPVYLRVQYRADPRWRAVRSLLTIHNIAYQGVFSKNDLWVTGLGWEVFRHDLLEYYDSINLLKGGIVCADAVNAVSRRYAQEIQTPAYGFTLDPVIRAHQYKVTGILNGVDYAVWSPAADKHLPVNYDASTVGPGKAICKAHLQQAAGLPSRPDVPLIGMVSRFTEQKGLSLIRGAAWDLLNHDVQLVFLGSGDTSFENFLEHLSRTFPHKVAVALEFNEKLAHQIMAGSDIYLMPSYYEPSGLNQLYALKYGTVPVARDTGGLSDSITEVSEGSLMQGRATGFLFTDYHPAALLWALRRALGCFAHTPEVWRQLQLNGMNQDFSWDHGAAEYERLYWSMVEHL